MKITVTEHMFIDAFARCGRGNQFTVGARRALYDWYTQLEDDRGLDMKYEIHTGYPTRSLQEAVDAGSSLRYGFSRTLERAIERATNMTKDIRSDVPVGVVVNGKVVAESTTDTGPGGVFTRQVMVMEG